MGKKLRFLPILLILLVIGIAASSPKGKTEAGNIIADGIFLGDEDLSGKTLNEAADAMEAYYEKIAASNFTIKIRKVPSDVLKKMESGTAVDLSKYDVISTVKVPVSTFGFDYSIEEALRVASTLGQTGKLVERYKALMNMKYGNAQLPLSYSIDGEKVQQYVEKVLAPQNAKDPVDAKFTWSKNGLQVSQKSQDGIKVNTKVSTKAILEAFDEGISDHMTCSAVATVTSPSVTSDSMKNINFTKVATYTTKFWRDETNWHRGHNIDLAAKYVNGSMIAAGQRVSLNQLIGQRTPERGFLIAHAFTAGKVIDAYGGGVCQFATTVYQCLLQTELTVNVRYAHSLAVSYVPYSQDATLDWGYCDLIFTNNWNNPIYIECSTTASSVTVSFYGVDERPKNRTVEYKTVIDEEIKTLYPQISLQEDKNPGTPTTDGETLSSIRSHVEKIVRVNGVVQSTTKMNEDWYRPLRTFVYVGCKGLNLTVKRENDIDKIYDANGNQLLMNSKYQPIYNGKGGYYLAKDYKHNENGVAIYSGGKLVPISGGTTHTHSYGSWTSNGNGTHTGTCSCGDKKTENCSYDSNGKCTKCGYTKPTETQPTQPSSSETQPSHTHSYGSWTSNGNGTHTGTCSCGEKKTEDCSYDSSGKCTKCGYTKPTEHTHSYGDWSYSHNDGSSPSSHTRTHSCSCGHSESETHNCTFSLIDQKASTTSEQGYKKYKCDYCGFTYTETLPLETTAAPEPTTTEAGGEGGNP